MLAPQGQGKRVPDPGSAEPKGALVLTCPIAADGENLYGDERKSRAWLNSLTKYAGARR